MDISSIDINLISRLCIFIILFGLTIKAIKLSSGLTFKIASIILILLLLYKMFI